MMRNISGFDNTYVTITLSTYSYYLIESSIRLNPVTATPQTNRAFSKTYNISIKFNDDVQIPIYLHLSRKKLNLLLQLTYT